MIKEKLFGKLNLQSIIGNPDFKEDSVREVIILPILKELGYSQENIVRSKSLQHPYLKVGSKRRPVNIIPDYLLKIEQNYAWVLDAKSPDQKITNDENVEQVYSYATHPEIRSNYFALCNGIQFSLFKTSETEKPILLFSIRDIDANWDSLTQILSPSSFQEGKNYTYESISLHSKEVFDYTNRPFLDEIPVRKQQAKRHFGVHGYFTKQTWNVVAEYITNYTHVGDLVLDPYGGSGITAIEAMMNGRRAINIDLNPMAVFMVQSLIAPVNTEQLSIEFLSVKGQYLKNEPHTKAEIQDTLKKYKTPKSLILPKGSDVETVDQLFSTKQMAELALLKAIILKQKDKNIRDSLMLAFSSTVNKHNLTFHYTKSEGGGDSGVFRYYRYRIAHEPGNMPLIQIFETKFSKVLSAKKEIQYYINDKTISNIQNIRGTATDLSFIKNETVDYIYTDPPYGKKIPYLDLSVMWNAWLDLEVTERDYELEAIEGGEHHKSKDRYNELMAKSIQEMYRVLKFDRWMSFVFAHKDPEFWHLIIDTAESCGFEYVGAIPQKNGQTSFKKRQNPFTVLSGQLIINFRKVRNPKTILKANLGMDMAQIVMQTIEGVIAKNDGASLEQINDELIIKGLELGFLDLLKKEYSDLTPLLLTYFDYDSHTERFTLPKNTKFKTHIDVQLRIRYYLISFLRRMENEKKNAHFDDIIQHIIPLLKNGLTPEDQTVSNILEDIGEKIEDDCWRLKRTGQTSLFD